MKQYFYKLYKSLQQVRDLLIYPLLQIYSRQKVFNQKYQRFYWKEASMSNKYYEMLDSTKLYKFNGVDSNILIYYKSWYLDKNDRKKQLKIHKQWKDLDKQDVRYQFYQILESMLKKVSENKSQEDISNIKNLNSHLISFMTLIDSDSYQQANKLLKNDILKNSSEIYLLLSNYLNNKLIPNQEKKIYENLYRESDLKMKSVQSLLRSKNDFFLFEQKIQNIEKYKQLESDNIQYFKDIFEKLKQLEDKTKLFKYYDDFVTDLKIRLTETEPSFVSTNYKISSLDAKYDLKTKDGKQLCQKAKTKLIDIITSLIKSKYKSQINLQIIDQHEKQHFTSYTKKLFNWFLSFYKEPIDLPKIKQLQQYLKNQKNLDHESLKLELIKFQQISKAKQKFRNIEILLQKDFITDLQRLKQIHELIKNISDNNFQRQLQKRLQQQVIINLIQRNDYKDYEQIIQNLQKQFSSLLHNSAINNLRSILTQRLDQNEALKKSKLQIIKMRNLVDNTKINYLQQNPNEQYFCQQLYNHIHLLHQSLFKQGNKLTNFQNHDKGKIQSPLKSENNYKNYDFKNKGSESQQTPESSEDWKKQIQECKQNIFNIFQQQKQVLKKSFDKNGSTSITPYQIKTKLDDQFTKRKAHLKQQLNNLQLFKLVPSKFDRGNQYRITNPIIVGDTQIIGNKIIWAPGSDGESKIVNNLVQEKTDLQKKFQRYRQTNESIKKDKIGLQKKLYECQALLYDTNVMMQAIQQNAQQNINTSRKLLQKEQNQNKYHKQQCVNLTKLRKQLQDQLVELNQKNKQLQGQLTEINKEIQQLKSQYKFINQQCGILQKEQANLITKQIQQYKSRLDSVNTEFDKVRLQYKQLYKSSQKLRNNHDDLKKDHKFKIETYQQNADKLNLQIKQLKANNQSLLQQKYTILKKSQQLQTKLAQIYQLLSQEKQLHLNKQQQITELSSKILGLQTQTTQLKSQLTKKEQERQKQESQKTRFKSEKERLQRQKLDQRKRNTGFRSNNISGNEQTQNKLIQVQQQLKKKISTIKILEQKIKKLQASQQKVDSGQRQFQEQKIIKKASYKICQVLNLHFKPQESPTKIVQLQLKQLRFQQKEVQTQQSPKQQPAQKQTQKKDDISKEQTSSSLLQNQFQARQTILIESSKSSSQQSRQDQSLNPPQKISAINSLTATQFNHLNTAFYEQKIDPNQFKQLTDANKQLTDTNIQLTETNKSLADINNNLKLDVEKLTTQLKEAQQTLQTKKNEFAHQLTSVYDSLTRKQQSQQYLKGQLITIKASLSQLQTKHQQSATTIQNRDKEIRGFNDTMKAKVNQLGEIIKGKEQEIKAKESQISMEKKVNEQLRLQISKNKQQYTQLDTTYKQQSQKINELASLQQIKSQRDGLQAQLKTFKEQYKVLKKQLASVEEKHEQNVYEIKMDYSKKIKDLSRSNTGGNSNSQETRSLQLQIENLKRQIKQLKDSKDNIQKIKKSSEQNFKQKESEFKQRENVLIQQKRKEEQKIKKYQQLINESSKNISNNTIAAKFLLSDRFFSGRILSEDYKKKYFLKEQIEQNINKKIKKTELLYRFDQKNATNFHEYIDGINNICLIVKTQKNIFGAFSQEKFEKGHKQSSLSKAFIFTFKSELNSITELTSFDISYEKENAKSLTYDDYYIIVGNSELRLKLGEALVYSNFGIQNGYYKPNESKVSALFKSGNNREVDLKSYEVHQVIFEEDKQQQEKSKKQQSGIQEKRQLE